MYVTHDGPVDVVTRVWGALLHAGDGAVVSHRTAGYLQGLVDDEPAVIDVSVAAAHRVTPRPRVVVHRRRRHRDLARAARSVPQTTLEETVLDLVEAAEQPDEVVGWVTRACQRRLTTASRLARAAAARRRLRHRRLVQQVLADVADGVASPLERRYAREVERRHGLPHGERNRRRRVRGRSSYSDVEYRSVRVRVELEGLTYHPSDLSDHDDVRDNDATLGGDVVLRYGWRAVTRSPCRVAAEIAQLLRARGWQGSSRACGPTCTAACDERVA